MKAKRYFSPREGDRLLIADGKTRADNPDAGWGEGFAIGDTLPASATEDNKSPEEIAEDLDNRERSRRAGTLGATEESASSESGSGTGSR